MKKLTKLLILVLSLLLTVNCLLLTAEAAVPHLINYQGRLTDRNGTPLSGPYDLTFKIYDVEISGNPLWQETHRGILIERGIFSIILGTITTLNLPFDNQYYLAIQVGTDPEMSPRQRITSSGYAIRAEKAETVEQPKVKADSVDPTAGYLVDKVDNVTIKVNTSTHKLSSIHGFQLFTSNGTFTAPAGVSKVYVTMVGGGGGGGGSTGSPQQVAGGGGGGGGAVIKHPILVTAGNNYSVTVGTAGSAGGIGGGGGSGGNSIFAGDSITINARGGAGGTSAQTAESPSTGGQGGLGGRLTGTNPDAYNASGTSGGGGIGYLGGNGANWGGYGAGGGGSIFGYGGTGNGTMNGNGFGGGGAGRYSGSPGEGGVGTAGFVLVEW